MSVHLAPRQRQILVAAAEGATIEETAHQLGISPQTVKNTRATIMRRHGAASMIDLFRRIGWLKVPSRSLPSEPWHCRHGIDLRTTPRCYLCEPQVSSVTSERHGLDVDSAVAWLRLT